MAGRRLDSSRRGALAFAEELLASAQTHIVHSRAVRFGPTRLLLQATDADWTTRFALDAFLRDEGIPPEDPAHLGHSPIRDLRLIIARQGQVPLLPPMEWARSWIDSRAHIPHELTHPYRISIDRHGGLVSVLDTVTGTGAVWLRDPPEIDSRILVTPFRIALNWMASLFGATLVHAAAVQVNGAGVLLAGPSGSGKSTLSLALASAGHRIVSDDCVLVTGSTAYAVFTRAKVDRRAQRLLPDLPGEPHPIPGGDHAKSTIDLPDMGETFAHQTSLALAIFPAVRRLSGSYPIEASMAYQRLLDDSLRETGGGTQRSRVHLAQLCAGLPAYRLLHDTPDDGRQQVERLVTEIRRRSHPDS